MLYSIFATGNHNTAPRFCGICPVKNNIGDEKSLQISDAFPKFRNVKAVIFDLDGVITDTAEQHYKAWQKLADDLGIHFDREKNEKLRGVSRRESLEIILGNQSQNYTEEEKTQLTDKKN